MSEPSWGDGTRSVAAGEGSAVPGAPLRPSPVFAAPFHLGDQPPRAGGADAYARTEHPTLRDFESAVGALDGGRCLSFATGMAAISAAVFACVSAGDRVVLPSDGYYTTRLLARDELERFGVRVDYVATPEIEAVAAGGGLDGARLVFLETPSNPLLDVVRHRRRRPRGARGGRDRRRRQHDRDPAGPAAAGARRRPHRGQRHQGAHRAQRPAAGPRQHRPTTSCSPRLQRWRNNTGEHPGPVRGVARPPLDEHAGPAAGPAGGERRGGRRVLAGSPAVTGVRWPWRAGDPSFALARPADAAPERRGLGRPGRRGGRRGAAVAAPGCGPRRPASAACTARSTGGRSGAATRSSRVRAAVLRHRGHRRPGRRPSRGPRTAWRERRRRGDREVHAQPDVVDEVAEATAPPRRGSGRGTARAARRR